MSATVITTYPQQLAFPPDDFQMEAINALAQGKNIVVCAPTGSGKTLIAEAAAYDVIKTGGRLFYTTPLKALNNQKYTDLVKQYGLDNVGLLTGDCSINRDAPLVVMTTEVYRNMLYGVHHERTLLDALRYVVLDECHFMNDPQRGTVWEESIIHTPQNVQMIALSATIANSKELAAWIEHLHGGAQLIESHWRPVPLRFHYFATKQNQLFGLFKPETTQLNPQLNRFGFPSKKTAREAPFRANNLIQQLHKQAMLPAIIFAFSRKGCDRYLQDTRHLDLLTPEERRSIKTQVHQFVLHNPVIDNHPMLWHICNGFASHHAGLLPALKQLVETLFQQGLIKVVFATETLAAGINMPARTTVITSISKRTDDGHRLLTASEFLQMSGRAGRRGMDTVGHVITVSSPYESAAEMALLARSKPEALNSRFMPTYGMVLNLLECYSLVQSEELVGKSFGAFTVQRRLKPLQEELSIQKQAIEAAAEFVCPAQLSQQDFETYLKTHDRLHQEYKLLNVYRKQAKHAKKDKGLQAELERVEGLTNNLKKQLHQTACYTCKDFKHHKKVLGAAHHAGHKAHSLDKVVKKEIEGHWQQFVNHYNLLRAEGYLTPDDKPTETGQLMSQLRTENEYFLTEVLLSGYLDDLTPGQLAGVVSALINDDNRENRYPAVFVTAAGEDAMNKIKKLCKRIVQVQRQFGVNADVRVNPVASGLVELWTNGMSWEELRKESNLDDGDVVRQLRRVSDVLRQMAHISAIPKQLRQTANDALYGLYRLPVSEVIEVPPEAPEPPESPNVVED